MQLVGTILWELAWELGEKMGSKFGILVPKSEIYFPLNIKKNVLNA